MPCTATKKLSSSSKYCVEFLISFIFSSDIKIHMAGGP